MSIELGTKNKEAAWQKDCLTKTSYCRIICKPFYSLLYIDIIEIKYRQTDTIYMERNISNLTHATMGLEKVKIMAMSFSAYKIGQCHFSSIDNFVDLCLPWVIICFNCGQLFQVKV